MVKNVTKFHQAKIAVKVTQANSYKNKMNINKQISAPFAKKVLAEDVFKPAKSENSSSKSAALELISGLIRKK